MDRAVNIGADVPYCVMRGTALAEGDRGETDQDHSGARLFCTDR